jgi:RNA polymerase sigma-70 factor (ECF subfamily)
MAAEAMVTQTPIAWDTLAAAAQGGDRRAYENLLKQISVYARRVLFKKVPDAALDDIVQDVLISVHKSLHTYRADRAFRPWLFAIINFRRMDFLRSHYAGQGDKNVPLEDVDYSLSTDTTPAGQSSELKDVQNALNTLPEAQRRIFERVKVEGHSIRDVAEEMGMNESAVKVSAHRTMKKLKRLLSR